MGDAGRSERVRVVLVAAVLASLLAVIGAASGRATHDTKLPECQPGQRFPTFSGPQFRDFVDAHRFLETVQLTSKPPIYGHAGADQRIQSLAEGRGYKLRSLTTASLGSADGQPLHPTAANAWRALQGAARSSGFSIVVASGFRTIERQREIVKSSLSGYSTDDIAAGRADGAINNMLRTRSIPGYSRHHSAHAIDIAVSGGSFGSFGGTAAFNWISANNYAVAKQYGFLPSYPAGAGPQGPDPEPWEYVYVGVQSIECPAVGGGASAVVTGPGTVEIFARGLDNAVWTRRFDGSNWSDWSSLGGVVTAMPGAVVAGPTQVRVFARGMDQALWSRTRTSGAWGAWTFHGGILASAPAATSTGVATTHVFATGDDHALWHLRITHGGETWQSLGGLITGAPAAVGRDTGRIEVFAPGADSALWTRAFDGGGWHGWASLGGVVTSGAGATATADGDLIALGRGGDGAVWARRRHTGTWGSWFSFGGIVTSPPSAVPRGATDVQVFSRGQDWALWTHLPSAGWQALGGLLR